MATKIKTDVYQMVTDKFIEALEGGTIPWHKPWCGVNGGAFNRISKKPYSLLNQLMLGVPGEYATYKQWESLGGKVKKGEKSKFIVFWKMLQVPTDDDEAVLNENGDNVNFKFIPVLRHFRVFHISQVEGVDPLPDEELEELKKTATERDVTADAIINSYTTHSGVKLKEIKSNRAFYRPATDEIVVPLREQYEVMEEFYSTTFHEMTHSTGAESRLNRKEISGSTSFGDTGYSKEELVAEIGAAMLCVKAGLDLEKSFDNSTAYVQNWLQALKNDKKLVVSAAGRAEKAVRYILREEASV